MLTLCSGTDRCQAPDEALLIAGDIVAAPQLGQLRFLPFESGPFENNGLTVLLREDGRLEKFEYKRKSSAAAFSGSAADIAERIAAADEKREDERRSDRAAARTEAGALRTEEIADLQFKIDQLTKQKMAFELANPTKDADEEETKRLNTQIALLTAQLAQRKLAAELASASP